jgi:hypothetical protein
MNYYGANSSPWPLVYFFLILTIAQLLYIYLPTRRRTLIKNVNNAIGRYVEIRCRLNDVDFMKYLNEMETWESAGVEFANCEHALKQWCEHSGKRVYEYPDAETWRFIALDLYPGGWHLIALDSQSKERLDLRQDDRWIQFKIGYDRAVKRLSEGA